MKKRTKKSVIVIYFCAMAILTFMVSNGYSGERPKFIKIAAASMGGTWFPLCAATAEIMNQKLEGVIATTTLGGGISNLKNIENGNIYMGMSGNSGAYLALKGLEPFTKEYKKVRSLFIFYLSPYHLIVRKDSKIFAVKDLVGKNLVVGEKGWVTEMFMRNLLHAHGLSYEIIKEKGGNINFAGFSQMRIMLLDRKVDFMPDTGIDPSPGIMEITARTPIRLIDIGEKGVKEVRKLNPGYSKITVPGGIYRGQEEDVLCVGEPTGMYISSDLDEKFVYEITKAIFENIKMIKTVHVALKDFSIETALNGAYVPLHPGAYKYYKEKGLEIQDYLRP